MMTEVEKLQLKIQFTMLSYLAMIAGSSMSQKDKDDSIKILKNLSTEINSLDYAS